MGRQDLVASLVVFLVALPLSLGIAIASGMPPASGLLTAMVGGLVVGTLAGSPLLVSGPAAGLTVIVWSIVSRWGAPALGLIVAVAGLCQITFGALRLGRFFRAVSPAVIQGMLSGIGVLIVASQCHVMLDDRPRGSGLQNLLALPSALAEVFALDSRINHAAAGLGLLTIGLIVVWERLPVASLRQLLPSVLVGISVSTALAALLGLNVKRVDVPDNLLQSIHWPDLSLVPQLGIALLLQGFVVAVVASAETLLTARAVDRMVPGHKTRYNRELMAQGVGNLLCGVLGGLPMTGVIVRSSVNVSAGARTRRSAILHGAWLLLLTLFVPDLLRLIPTAALAALLVYAGVKLLDVRALNRLRAYGRAEFIICLVTLGTIVVRDLLTGVLVGIGLSAARLLYVFSHLQIRHHRQADRTTLTLVGAATFLSLPKLADELERVAPGTELHVDIGRLTYIDHACLELLLAWEADFTGQGGSLTLDWGAVQAKFRAAQAGSGSPALEDTGS